MKKKLKEKGLFILILSLFGIISFLVPFTMYSSVILSMTLFCLYIVLAGIFQLSAKIFQISKDKSKRDIAYWTQAVLVALLINVIIMTIMHDSGIIHNDYRPEFPYPKTTMVFMIGTLLFTLPSAIKVFSN